MSNKEENKKNNPQNNNQDIKKSKANILNFFFQSLNSIPILGVAFVSLKNS